MKRRNTADEDKEELPQEEEQVIFYVYGHSKHNHPFASEEQRSRSLKTDLIPDENPPKNFCTPDKLEWQFLQTFADYDTMDAFRRENQCEKRCGGEEWCRIRSLCKRKRSHNCKFMLLAMKTTKLEYHFYKHGEHNHNDNNELVQRKMQGQADENQQVIDNDEDEEPELDDHEAEKPPRAITKNVMGQQKQYYYLKTVKTMAELDKFRFKNNCSFKHEKPLRILKSCIIPCTKKKTGTGKTCNFELLALPSIELEKVGMGMHVDGHVLHSDHPSTSASGTKKKPGLGDGQQNLDQHEEMEDDEGGDEVEDEEEGENEEEEEEEKEDDELLEQEGDTGDEEEEEEQMEDVLVLDDEVKVKQEEEEVKIEIIEEENPQANPREETLEERLAKANNKVYNWMATIEPNAIGQTLGDWDKMTLLKFVEMADQEIREHPEKLNMWLPWMNCAIPKCLPQIEGFNVRFKDLIKLTFNR